MTPLLVWLVGVAVLLVAAGGSVVRSLPLTARAAPAAGVVVVVLVGEALDLIPDAPTRAVHVLGVASVGLLAVSAGSAVTAVVLGWVMRDDVVPGSHGGILVASADEPAPTPNRPEVLRGGAAIGYLERFAIVGAALVGRLEIIAAVIAIKGLGRFTELDTAAARERFIVGTLTSACWAGTGAAAAVSLV